MGKDKVYTSRSKTAYPPPPPLGAGAGLADLKEDPPTRPPERAANASSGVPAEIRKAAAKAAATGKSAFDGVDCGCWLRGCCALHTNGRCARADLGVQRKAGCRDDTPVRHLEWTAVCILQNALFCVRA